VNASSTVAGAPQTQFLSGKLIPGLAFVNFSGQIHEVVVETNGQLTDVAVIS